MTLSPSTWLHTATIYKLSVQLSKTTAAEGSMPWASPLDIHELKVLAFQISGTYISTSHTNELIRFCPNIMGKHPKSCENDGKTPQIPWKSWGNAPKLRDSSSVFICPMKRNGYYSGSWSMVSKPPSRIQAGILVRSTRSSGSKCGWTEYDMVIPLWFGIHCSRYIYIIYIRIPMNGFHYG